MSDADQAARRACSADTADLLGVVLAGGKSTRMGIDKATLPHLGSSREATISYLDQATQDMKFEKILSAGTR